MSRENLKSNQILMKILFVVILFLICQSVSAQRYNKCGFMVLDKSSHQIIRDANVIIRNKRLSTDSNGIYHINCSYNDSIYIAKLGYQTILKNYNRKKSENKVDTFFVELNTFDLAPITIKGKERNTRYRIGRRNRTYI